jgi:hypothetical protein
VYNESVAFVLLGLGLPLDALGLTDGVGVSVSEGVLVCKSVGEALEVEVGVMGVCFVLLQPPIKKDIRKEVKTRLINIFIFIHFASNLFSIPK